MYGKPRLAKHFTEFPDGGGYPIGFLEWALQVMRCADYSKVLHVCSGSVISGVRVDIRREMNPSVVADAINLPFESESFDFILSDPPYSEDYASNLYGTGNRYPTPSAILQEAERVLRPNGLIGLLHFQVPMSRKPMRLLKVYGVTTGAGYAIRAWSLFQKMSAPNKACTGRRERSAKKSYSLLIHLPFQEIYQAKPAACDAGRWAEARRSKDVVFQMS